MYTRSLSIARAGFLATLLLIAWEAQGKTREDCEKVFQPQTGQSGKDVIWVPTDDALVRKMLELAKVTKHDKVYDLGAGDGKIAIMAGKEFGARAVGIEYNPDMVRLGQCLAEVAGVTDRVTIRQGDIFESDFSDATVITLYLLPDLNLRLRPTLLDMKPGTRVVSHSFTMAEWEPDAQVSSDSGHAYLWIIPAKVAGEWTFQPRDGKGDAPSFTVKLEQTFQQLSGSAGSAQLSDAKIEGPRIEFSFPGEAGLTRVAGTVEGDRIEAKVTHNGRTTAYTARRTT